MGRHGDGSLRRRDAAVARERSATERDFDAERAVWRRTLLDAAERLMVLRTAAMARGERVMARLAEPLLAEMLAVAARVDAEARPSRSGVAGSRPGAGDANGARLTARELECLRWCAAGKTYWETAIILGVAERTVDFHMRSARRKLGASSNANCVARALLLGLL